MTAQVNETDVKVNQVEVKSPLNGPNGPFALHIYKTSGGEFTKAASLTSEVQNKAGDTVKITYQAVPNKTGGFYNKILKVEESKVKIDLHSEGTDNLLSTPVAKGTLTSSPIKNRTLSQPLSTGFSNKSARIGGLMHDAVALSIHNGTINKKVVTVEEVISLTKALLDQVEANLD